MKKQSSIIFELDNIVKMKRAGLQKCENSVIHTVAKGLILASLKFKSTNIVKSTKSNLKKEELEAVVRRCSSK